MLPQNVLLRNAAGFFFPRLCIVCRNPLGASHWLCLACENKLNANNAARDACLRCGENKNLRPCSCSTNSYPFESIISLFDFDTIVRPVVHEIKYCGSNPSAIISGSATELLSLNLFLREWMLLFRFRCIRCGILSAAIIRPTILRAAYYSITARVTISLMSLNANAGQKHKRNCPVNAGTTIWKGHFVCRCRSVYGCGIKPLSLSMTWLLPELR